MTTTSNSQPQDWDFADGGGIAVGTAAHKNAFCGMLLDTFDPYKPAVIDWPRLEGDALARLTSLPFWDMAVQTEGETSMRMQLLADATDDPLISKAIGLNAFEERRHKQVLENMIRFYGIEIEDEPDYPVPSNPEWAFVQTGYGECFDSFFAFGLFRLARESGFFPSELVEVFEPVIQEEARHILFFANWLAYTQAHKPVLRRPFFLCSRLTALALKTWNRLKFARESDNKSNMTIKGGEAMGIDLSPRHFLDLCLTENNRRLARYDSRLQRPQFMPRLARAVRPLVGRA